MFGTIGPEFDAELAYRREQLTGSSNRYRESWLPRLLRRRRAHG